jgi:hypothetical protein
VPEPAERPEGAPPPAPVRRSALLAAIAERNQQLAHEADADKRRDALFTALRCVFWMVLGAIPLAWAFHTTDPVYGRAAFVTGIGIANAGVIFSLLGFYRRGERRGDW